jgi:hypothetical protein
MSSRHPSAQLAERNSGPIQDDTEKGVVFNQAQDIDDDIVRARISHQAFDLPKFMGPELA